MDGGVKDAAYLAAASIDRYLSYTKGFQKYGTNRVIDPVSGEEYLVPVDRVTDEERATYGVPSLQELLNRWLERRSAGSPIVVSGRKKMIDLQRLNIRQMQEDDPPALALAFADMNKTQGQYERYWQENFEGRRVTIIAVLDGEVVGYTNVIWEPDYEAFRQRGIPEINIFLYNHFLHLTGVSLSLSDRKPHPSPSENFNL